MNFTLNNDYILVFSEKERLNNIAEKLSEEFITTKKSDLNKVLDGALKCIDCLVNLIEQESSQVEFAFDSFITNYSKNKSQSSLKTEKIAILYHYLIYLLGKYSSDHVKDIIPFVKEKRYDTNGVDIFNAAEMLMSGLEILKKDIRKSANELNHSYGSTLIFQTLLERNFILTIRQKLDEEYFAKFIKVVKINKLGKDELKVFNVYKRSFNTIVAEKRDRQEFGALDNGTVDSLAYNIHL